MATNTLESSSTGAFEASKLSNIFSGWEEQQQQQQRTIDLNTNFGSLNHGKTSFTTLNDTLRTSTLILAGLCIGFFISSILVIVGLI